MKLLVSSCLFVRNPPKVRTHDRWKTLNIRQEISKVNNIHIKIVQYLVSDNFFLKKKECSINSILNFNPTFTPTSPSHINETEYSRICKNVQLMFTEPFCTVKCCIRCRSAAQSGAVGDDNWTLINRIHCLSQYHSSVFAPIGPLLNYLWHVHSEISKEVFIAINSIVFFCLLFF